MTADPQRPALLLFLAFTVLTLAITTWTSRRRHDSPEEFYAGGRLFSPLENGFAIAGGHLSAASFLGISGLIALFGYDGVLYAVGFLVAWLLVLFVAAELVRNCGRFTLADVLAVRLRGRPVRIAAGASALTVSLLYLVAQLVGAGSLVALLLGDTSDEARGWTVIGVGALMIVHVAVGGMRATTWIQIVKAALLLGGAMALTVLLLLRFHGDPGGVLDTAATRSGHGRDFLLPGLAHGEGWAARLDFISLGVALVLGTAGLPHTLSRLGAVPTARAARRSVVWAIGLMGAFYLMTIVLGFGAAAVLGTDQVRASSPSGNTAVPLLALHLGGGADSTGGTVLFAIVAAVACATIPAVVAGMTLSSAASVAHDLRAALRRRPARSPRAEVTAARLAAVGVGVAATGLGLFAQDLNVAFLVGLAFAVAASAHLPVLLLTLFWRRLTTRGAVWAVYGGLLSAVLLMALSPVVSGSPDALFPGVDFHLFPLRNPGLVSIPLGFLAGWLGTVTSAVPADQERYAETEVRALTGAGAV